MKRLRVESEIETLGMADCLISLSRSTDSDHTPSFRGRVFACKTCNREFSSFQALGGHRASHRKPKSLSPAAGDSLPINSAVKTKAHECSICGVEFPVGQALGGHMRRHRNSSPAAGAPAKAPQIVSDDSDSDGGSGFVRLDLNLTPLENDLVRLQLMAPPVGCWT